MDDDPWISWKMAQIALIEAVTRKAGRSDCDTKCSAGPVCVPVIFSLFFFFFFSRRSDVVVFGRGARPKPAEFPFLRKVPLTSAVSEILRFLE